ncbi:gamma carbonic anhydrase family protein [Yinghuangia sp. ASG 101]|uniref:gamma carbonic anhydrase family protein n=1 Tax=Yinghuangia sp. ASG 101 TaxID=2896848 RepID=UPI001E519CAD|nr:gamma carbonic anhydrase family protein [Yinghuangia sp. ASG 101]UGQ11768.1 gamma carbonic anhydrase family protein [Yinghuangia sp. ASG 101]
MITLAYQGKSPRVAPSALVADNVYLIGDVEIGEECSIWPGVVIRSDTTPIRIGNNVHIEDNSVLHTGTVIEDNVMIGHNCTIEGFIGHDSLVGNTAALMPYARLGAFSTLAAGSVMLDGSEIPDYCFAVGSPAKVHSKIDPDNPAHRARTVGVYLHGMRQLADDYRAQGIWGRA